MLPVPQKQPFAEVLQKRCSFKNFAKFTGKLTYRISFLDKVASLQAATLSKKRFPYKCFSVNFAKF